MTEKTMSVLTYLSHGGWIDERTLTDRFGKEPVEQLFQANAIERRWHDDSLFASYQYRITQDGKNLI